MEELQAAAAASGAEIPDLHPGRIVLYTPWEHEGYFAGFDGAEPIVGVVTRVWDVYTGCANLRLLPDGLNQNPAGKPEWVTSRLYDETGAPGTWRYAPRD